MQTSIKRMPSRKVAASACSKGILVPCSRTDQQPQCLRWIIRAVVAPAGAASVNCHQLLDITGSIKFFSSADELERFVLGAAVPSPSLTMHVLAVSAAHAPFSTTSGIIVVLVGLAGTH